MVARPVAERAGRSPDDRAIRAMVGALLGVWTAVIMYWASHPELDLAAELDAAMGHLEAGLPL
jgi:hypothetical protein